MKKPILLFIILFNCLQFSFSQETQKNTIEISGNNNTVKSINQKNIYIGKQFKNFYSTTNVDKVINLTPLFQTIKKFITEIEKNPTIKTEGFKMELKRLNEEFEKISNSTDGNHIKNLDIFLNDFLSIYIKALKTKRLNFNDNIGNAFVVLSDYKRNKNDFKINSIDGKYFLSNTKKRKIQNNSVIVFPYKEGMAKIKFKNKYGFIDIYGNLIVDIKYDKVKDFSNGYAICYNGNYVYIVNKKGEFLKKGKSLNVANGDLNFYNYNNGWFKIGKISQDEIGWPDSTHNYEESFNFINTEFELLNKNENYLDATDFCNGFTYVKDSLSYLQIDYTGRTIKRFNKNIVKIDNNSKCLYVFYENSQDKLLTQNGGTYPPVYSNIPIIKKIINVKNDNFDYNYHTYTYSIIADSVIYLKDNFIAKYRIRKSPINQIEYKYNEPTFSSSTSTLRDNSGNILLGPYKKIEILSNDYFLYSSHEPKIIKYKLYQNINDYINKSTSYNFTYYKSLGLINSNSEVIISENKNYNTLLSYNNNLFVFGKVHFFYDNLMKKNKINKRNFWFTFNKYKKITNNQKNSYIKVYIIKCALVNRNGIEILPMEYDNIKLLSNELVETEKNGIKKWFYIDEFGNAIEIKSASR